jgi:hypothetical protein
MDVMKSMPLMTPERLETLKAIAAVEKRHGRLTYEAIRAEMGGLSHNTVKARIRKLRETKLFDGLIRRNQPPRCRVEKPFVLPPPPEQVDRARVAEVWADATRGMGDGRGEADDPIACCGLPPRNRVVHLVSRWHPPLVCPHELVPPLSPAAAMLREWKKRKRREREDTEAKSEAKPKAKNVIRNRDPHRVAVHRSAPLGRAPGYSVGRHSDGGGRY